MILFNLSALAVRERAITLFLIVLISVAGGFSFLNLGRAEDPAFTTVTLQDGTPPAEVQEEFYQARNLPSGVIGPMINDEYADVTFALFALKAKGEAPRVLVRDAETLRQRMLHVPGVKKVNILGA